MKAYRTIITAVVLAVTLTLATIPTVKAGIILNGDGFVCDTVTGDCCDPRTESCPEPDGQGLQADDDPSLLDLLSAAITSFTRGIILSGD